MKLARWSRNCLLWLALLLPLAQAVAAAHAVTHLGERRDGGSVHLSHCELCLGSAALDGLATAPAAPQAPLLTAAPARVAALAQTQADTTPRPPYPARAPPSAA